MLRHPGTDERNGGRGTGVQRTLCKGGVDLKRLCISYLNAIQKQCL